MKKTKGKRISARIDDDVADRLYRLAQLMNRSVSEVIAESLRAFSYARLRGEEKPWKALERRKFIGCASGPVDLSEHYKDYFGSGLSKKYDHR